MERLYTQKTSRTYATPHFDSSSEETMGTKLKLWIDHEELGCCLYKQVK